MSSKHLEMQAGGRDDFDDPVRLAKAMLEAASVRHERQRIQQIADDHAGKKIAYRNNWADK